MMRGIDRDSIQGYLLILTFVSGVNLMTELYAAATKFVRSEEGASLAEYGLLLALIAVVCIGGMTLLGTSINSMFTSLSTSI